VHRSTSRCAQAVVSRGSVSGVVCGDVAGCASSDWIDIGCCRINRPAPADTSRPDHDDTRFCYARTLYSGCSATCPPYAGEMAPSGRAATPQPSPLSIHHQENHRQDAPNHAGRIDARYSSTPFSKNQAFAFVEKPYRLPESQRIEAVQRTRRLLLPCAQGYLCDPPSSISC
jgi:hypothetical protein